MKQPQQHQQQHPQHLQESQSAKTSQQPRKIKSPLRCRRYFLSRAPWVIVLVGLLAGLSLQWQAIEFRDHQKSFENMTDSSTYRHSIDRITAGSRQQGSNERLTELGKQQQSHLSAGGTFQNLGRPDNAINSTSPYSYAFVIGGCDPANPTSYQNYLYNIAVAARILKERGSTADVIALLQVSDVAVQTELAPEDVNILHALGVHVYYIPQTKVGKQSFYRTQLDKFRVLGLTQYKRILYMDCDVMPTANLDFFFLLSERGTLKENMIIQGLFEPANGGFFMLEPGHWQQVQDIITWRETTASRMSYPFFDIVQGWGHALEPDDPWRAEKVSGTNWSFVAAFADQGLLYHYTKYARQSVSLVMRNGTVENWGMVNESFPNGTTVSRVKLLQRINNPFSPALRKSFPKLVFWPFEILHSYVHWTGPMKPWRGGPPKDCCLNATACCSDERGRFASAKRYWFYQLAKINEELQLGLDLQTKWATGDHNPSLGLFPAYRHVLNASTDITTPLRRSYPGKS